MFYTIALILFLISLLFLAAYGIHSIVIYIRARLRPEDTPQLNLQGDPPMVTFQLVVCNEGEVVATAIHSIMAVDYPKDRFELQICDDSSDKRTSDICHQLTTEYQEKYFQISHLQREEKVGFKPGNLNHANQFAKGEYITIIDADFEIPAEFLQRNLPLIVDAPKVALVQTYWEHRNHDANLLTQAFQSSYDVHLMIEQQTWNNWEMWMQFNGSCGIWRKAALDEQGGWPVGVGVEDVYMSYIVQLKGWKISFSNATTSNGQITDEIESFRNQQGRWALSCGTIFRSLGRKILTANTSWANREQAVFRIGGYLVYVGMLGTMLLAWPMLQLILLDPFYNWVQYASATAFAILMFGNGLVSAEANKRRKYGFWKTLKRSFLASMQQGGMAPLVGIRFLLGMLGVSLHKWRPSNAKGSKNNILSLDKLFETVLVSSVIFTIWQGVRHDVYLLFVPMLVFSAGVFFLLTIPIWNNLFSPSQQTPKSTFLD